MLIAFLLYFLATNNLSVTSLAEYEILIQKENIRKRMVCFVCFEMPLHCNPIFSLSEWQPKGFDYHFSNQPPVKHAY